MTCGPLLLHDNAPAHVSHVAQGALRDFGFQQLPHPPYSLDLAPSDYYLFGHLKKALRGRRFLSDEELKGATKQWFLGQSQEFFCQGINKLYEWWDKCINIAGEYVEK